MFLILKFGMFLNMKNWIRSIFSKFKKFDFFKIRKTGIRLELHTSLCMAAAAVSLSESLLLPSHLAPHSLSLGQALLTKTHGVKV